jgi:hypothetical protein
LAAGLVALLLLAAGLTAFLLVFFFELASSRAVVAPCSATAADFEVLVAALVFIVVLVLLAVDPRTTIDHSALALKQVNSSRNRIDIFA